MGRITHIFEKTKAEIILGNLSAVGWSGLTLQLQATELLSPGSQVLSTQHRRKNTMRDVFGEINFVRALGRVFGRMYFPITK